jgi:phage terminase small subunit
MKRLDAARLVPVVGGGGTPPEPAWGEFYDDAEDAAIAHDQWGTITRELAEAQTLSAGLGDMIARLVRFRVEFARAAGDIARRGAVLVARRSAVPQTNLNWIIMRQASEVARGLELELGLSPLARGKVSKVQHAKKTPRAADAYLSPVARS